MHGDLLSVHLGVREGERLIMGYSEDKPIRVWAALGKRMGVKALRIVLAVFLQKKPIKRRAT
jgi:hypothetical protein